MEVCQLEDQLNQNSGGLCVRSLEADLKTETETDRQRSEFRSELEFEFSRCDFNAQGERADVLRVDFISLILMFIILRFL